ncbi:MAG: hypothetical protein VX075_13505, partial [Pseudomonadota bacterium]|nr:hypothetical protein [Pseudomonadota bacterium]
VITPHVICRETEKEVADLCRAIVEAEDAGCDGLQINFFDFAPDLEFFGERVMPLLAQAGLRYAW